MKKELETLIQKLRIYSLDIGMEFGIEKCTMLIMKSGKTETTEGIELSTQKITRTFGEKENCKYSGIIEVDTIKQRYEKKIRVYSRITRKFEIKLWSRNLIK